MLLFFRRAHVEFDAGLQLDGPGQHPRGGRRLLRVPRERQAGRAEHPLDTKRELLATVCLLIVS